MSITKEDVFASIQEKFGDAILSWKPDSDFPELETTRETIEELMSFLKSHETFQFIFLTDLCGIHYPNNLGKELGVVYHIHSWVHNFRLRIKVYFSQESPTIPTLSFIWPTANWMERETYDFFGIHFVGHPDLRRILNMDEMDYFPLRKEYPLEDGTREDKVDMYFGR